MVSVATFAPFSALTGCPSSSPRTTSVQVDPMGDALYSTYDGDNSGGFIVPGTRTYVAMSLHRYGIMRQHDGESTCGAGSSESWWTSVAPGTNNYQEFELYLYDLKDIVAGANGSQPVYQTSPYAYMALPEQLNLFPELVHPGRVWSVRERSRLF